MEKQFINYFPFSVSAEQKKSKAGNQYISIGICHKSKDKDGQDKKTYFNLIDERDLLVIASACENMYHKIIRAKNNDFLAKQEAQQQPKPTTGSAYLSAKNGEATPAPEPIDDKIPF